MADMIDEHGMSLWARVCATVNRIGQPRTVASQPVVFPTQPRHENFIDLHGLKLQDAWREVRTFIEETPHRDVIVITGQGRMSYELPDWLTRCPRYQSVKELNGGGAFKVRVRPKR
jgi:hypothetical protein